MTAAIDEHSTLALARPRPAGRRPARPAQRVRRPRHGHGGAPRATVAEAPSAVRWPRATAPGPPCWPRSPTTCAPRSPRSRRPSTASATRTSTWSAEDEDELLATIEESADRLDALVTNLLDMSRLQTGTSRRPARPGRSGRRRPHEHRAAARRRADRGRRSTTSCRCSARRRAARPGASPTSSRTPSSTRPVDARVRVDAAADGDAGRRCASSTPGPAWPDQDRDRLFEPFQRLGDVPQRRRRRARAGRRPRTDRGDGWDADRRGDPRRWAHVSSLGAADAGQAGPA